MDEVENITGSENHSTDPGDVVDVFEPHLTLAAKPVYGRRRGVNFRRLYIGAVDFAGDRATDLDGIAVHFKGGILRPAPDLSESLKAVTDGNGTYRLEGHGTPEEPYAVFDLFPDGYNQSGKISVEKEGMASIEEEYDFNPPPLNWLFDVAESLIWAFFIAMIIRLIFFQTFFIPSGSMMPTLYEGDRIVANKLVYKTRQPMRGEVVIFKVYNYFNNGELDDSPSRIFSPAGRASFAKDDSLGERFILKDYIKRVAGLPGDEVRIEDGQLYINSEPVDEPWISDPVYDFNYDFGPEIVPEGCIFVLGDNHRNSQDSHKLGYLPVSNVVGKAMFVFYPLKNIKLIR